MSSSYNFGRPRSSDSTPSRHSSDYFGRVHSVPRYNKISSKYSYSPEFDLDGSPVMNIVSQSMNSDSLSPHNAARPKRKLSQASSKDLKRKMVFNLHEEVQKPVHTIVLREISDSDMITQMCLETMTSMMKSKAHRKYLHHLNNSALPSEEPLGNYTNNAGKKKPTITQRNDSNTSTINRNKERLVPLDIREYEIIQKRISTQRWQEINALRNLRSQLPSEKVKLSGIEHKEKKHVDDGSTDRTSHQMQSQLNGEHQADMKKSVKIALPDNLQDDDDSAVRLKDKKVVKLLTAEETLKTHYLRLSQRLVSDLENTMRENGKDPGIVFHRNIEDISALVFGDD